MELILTMTSFSQVIYVRIFIFTTNQPANYFSSCYIAKCNRIIWQNTTLFLTCITSSSFSYLAVCNKIYCSKNFSIGAKLFANICIKLHAS